MNKYNIYDNIDNYNIYDNIDICKNINIHNQINNKYTIYIWINHHLQKKKKKTKKYQKPNKQTLYDKHFKLCNSKTKLM